MTSPLERLPTDERPQDAGDEENASKRKFNFLAELADSISDPAWDTPGEVSLHLLYKRLRFAQRQYQERRKSAPPEFNPVLGRKWFWRILIVGAALPLTSFIGFLFWRNNAVPTGQVLNDLIGWMLSLSILFVLPFLAYAIHSAKRLRHDHSQLRPVKGGLIGLSAVYALFHLVFLPWGVSRASHDPAGMAEAMVIYFLLIVPLLGLGALVLGRKLAPAHLPVWVGGRHYGAANAKPESSDPTTPSGL